MAKAKGKRSVTLRGIPVSEGVAIERVYVLKEDPNNGDLFRLKKNVPKEKVSEEKARLEKAYQKADQDLSVRIEELLQHQNKESAEILQAHQVMLRDPNLRKGIEENIAKECCTAEYAVLIELQKTRQSLESKMKEDYFRFWGDFQDLEKRLISNLRGETVYGLEKLTEESILVTTDLTPEQTLSFDLGYLKGIATDLGGPTSHTAILTRTHRIPAVVGLKNISSKVRTGDLIILDGQEGKVILNPTKKVLQNYERKRTLQLAEAQSLTTYHSLSAETLDGQRINLFANIESPDEIPVALERGAMGIGLYRTEFLFKEGLPDEEKHFEAYQKAVEYLDGKPLVIRTLDLGGDKFIKEAGSHRETNPFLGCRSIRLCLQERPELFLDQLRAILRVSAQNPNVSLMFPMISTIAELKEAFLFLEKAKEELGKRGQKYNAKIRVGMMIEIPATAIMADSLAKHVDFFSIGTNDLTQYSLAVDRNNERVAHLYKPIHPAILRLIKYIIRTAYKNNIEVSMCGEMPTDVSYALLLLGMGLQNFSLNSASIPKIIKSLRQVRMRKVIDIACSALQFEHTEEVHYFLENQYEELLSVEKKEES